MVPSRKSVQPSNFGRLAPHEILLNDLPSGGFSCPCPCGPKHAIRCYRRQKASMTRTRAPHCEPFEPCNKKVTWRRGAKRAKIRRTTFKCENDLAKRTQFSLVITMARADRSTGLSQKSMRRFPTTTRSRPFFLQGLRHGILLKKRGLVTVLPPRDEDHRDDFGD
jgi:hypothetical protein